MDTSRGVRVLRVGRFHRTAFRVRKNISLRVTLW
jgi:hypothetical protein